MLDDLALLFAYVSVVFHLAKKATLTGTVQYFLLWTGSKYLGAKRAKAGQPV